MKTAAIISTATIAGSIAFAAGQQSGSRQSQGIPSGVQAHSMHMQEEFLQARSRMAGGCTRGADKNWFTTIHLLPDTDSTCRVRGMSGDGKWIDVNGDGIPEQLIGCSGVPGLVVYDGQVLENGSPIYLQQLISEGPSITIRNDLILGSAAQAGPILDAFPSAWRANSFVELRDMDDDRDLDILVWGSASGKDGHLLGTVAFWIENTGFQHATRLTGDLDGDGSVNGADLGILLFNWRD